MQDNTTLYAAGGTHYCIVYVDIVYCTIMGYRIATICSMTLSNAVEYRSV